MKYREFHKWIKSEGWIHIRTEGSHYIYEKQGRRYVVPYHGAKEIGYGLKNKIIKEMGLIK